MANALQYPRLYACGLSSTVSANDILPSPTSMSVTLEQIWSEDTGRAQSGANIARMEGKSITGKKTYNIKWDVLRTDSDSRFPTAWNKLKRIQDNLEEGFFKFGVSNDDSLPTTGEYYRSEIAYDTCVAGDGIYYRDVSVQVIER